MSVRTTSAAAAGGVEPARPPEPPPLAVLEERTTPRRRRSQLLSRLLPATSTPASALAHARSLSASLASTALTSASVDPTGLFPLPAPLGGPALALEPTLKISDFGLSQICLPGERLLKVCGTWAYAAPEMSDASRKGYDAAFDVWSFGVTLYVTLAGAHPFDPTGAAPTAEIKRAARSATYTFEGEEWAAVSPLAKDLISRLIVRDPAQRLSAAGMLHHPWFALPGEVDATRKAEAAGPPPTHAPHGLPFRVEPESTPPSPTPPSSGQASS